MLSKVPVDISKIKQGDLNKETLRSALIAELDAVNLYEEMANITDNEEVERVLLDIIDDEMEHIAMFLLVLLEIDDDFLKKFADWGLIKNK